MATVVTVMNMKGGVGKSTVTMHLGGMLAHYAYQELPPMRVLIIDYDPQFNLSQAFTTAKQYFSLEKQRKTTIAILQEDHQNLDPFKLQVPGNSTPPKPEDLVFNIHKSKTDAGLLDLIPSTLDLMYVALGDTSHQIQPIEERFRKFINACRKKYDIILMDCHPAGSIFTKTALQNSDHVLIPVAPSQYALRGIGMMMQFITAKSLGNAGPTPHILFNSVPRAGTAPEETAIRLEKDLTDICLKSTLKRYKAFSDPLGGEGFVWQSKAPYSTTAFNNLSDVTDEFIQRVRILSTKQGAKK
jgi:chromosome partitioning protein